MFKNKTIKIILWVIMFFTFAITFYFGVFANPNFNIHDFCMNLTTEILGVVIVLLLIDNYAKVKNKK